ncbi:MAG: F0F1 ATP synthase subunit delta [Jatrophihabitantaceae bacterium]
MRSASRAASRQVRGPKRAAIEREQSVESLLELAAELYSVADLLVAQPRLRRIAGDPAAEPDARAELVGGLLAEHVRDTTREIVQAVVRERWSTPWDLTDALETAGDDALFAGAERGGDLNEVEDELFRFERVLDAESELTTLLDEAPVDADRRVALLDDVLADKVHPVTKALLEHAIRSRRKQSLTLAIDDLLEEAAARQSQSLARVISAIEMTPEQVSRLTESLSELYGRPIAVRTAIVPAVGGGLVVRVGDEVIDGSVAARMSGARSALAGQASRPPTKTRTRQGKH